MKVYEKGFLKRFRKEINSKLIIQLRDLVLYTIFTVNFISKSLGIICRRKKINVKYKVYLSFRSIL